MYSSKNFSAVYFVSTFKYKTAFLVIFKSISAANWPFWCYFWTLHAAWGAYLTPLTPSTTTTWLGTTPANSRRTK
jgi:hypothetical protein